MGGGGLQSWALPKGIDVFCFTPNSFWKVASGEGGHRPLPVNPYIRKKGGFQKWAEKMGDW